MPDRLLKFSFTGVRVRGELVQMADTWRDMTAHRRYPPAVMRVLGEMVAAAALLASNIKFNGALVMQVYGDGPLQLLVVECQSDLALRATAKVRDEPIADDIPLRDLMNRNGRGRFSITLDPKDPLPGQQPYQGIVPLEGDTRCRSAADVHAPKRAARDAALAGFERHGRSGIVAAALAQRRRRSMPRLPTMAWEHLIALAQTVTSEELLNLSPDDVSHRLFWQESLEHYAPLTPRFQCTCSRERIGKMLLSLGQEEVDSIITEQGSVTRHLRVLRTHVFVRSGRCCASVCQRRQKHRCNDAGR